jgi:hypothetical protein
MGSKEFIQGIICWLVAFSLYYFFLKGEKPSSKETNWQGITGSSYIGLWGCVIALIIMGVISILQTFGHSQSVTQ